MTFNKEFLRKIQERLANSDSYRMTKQSVEFLLKSQRLYYTDKNIILDAIRNDVCQNGDPLSLKQLWKENIHDSSFLF
jgi:hypothetical protein